MFLLAGTTDAGRHRACTATAIQALRQHGAMTAAGLMPVVTDRRGRRLSLETLRSRARGEVDANTDQRPATTRCLFA